MAEPPAVQPPTGSGVCVCWDNCRFRAPEHFKKLRGNAHSSEITQNEAHLRQKDVEWVQPRRGVKHYCISRCWELGGEVSQLKLHLEYWLLQGWWHSDGIWTTFERTRALVHIRDARWGLEYIVLVFRKQPLFFVFSYKSDLCFKTGNA